MHYTVKGSPIITDKRRNSLKERISNEVVPAIPSESWQKTSELLPLMYDTSPLSIAVSCLPFCDGTTKTNSVYVLECIKNDGYKRTAAMKLGKTNHRWNGLVEDANRAVYVGVTTNLIRRLDQHINDSGNKAANFTTVFPPIRILMVSWYHSYSEAERAEVMTADLLREKYPYDYISQPG